MAKGNSRSSEIEVSGENAIALAAAFRGVYHFLGGRVSNWEVIPATEDNPDGGLVAHGFSVNAGIDPDTLISGITGRNRRLELFPFYNYLQGETPVAYTDPQDMTNWMTSFFKGSVEDGTNKTPEYVRTAVAAYKQSMGLSTRRGPKRKIVRLENIDELDEAAIANIPQDKLAAFLELATRVKSNVAATATESPAEVATA